MIVFSERAFCDESRTSCNAAVSFVGFREFVDTSLKPLRSIFGVNGLGNLPGKVFGRPLFVCFLPSLSTTCAPKETDLFRLVVPGVMRMPLGLVGDIPRVFSKSLVCLVATVTVTRLELIGFCCAASFSFELSDIRTGFGVPTMACFRARYANTGAGVSGASRIVSNSEIVIVRMASRGIYEASITHHLIRPPFLRLQAKKA